MPDLHAPSRFVRTHVCADARGAALTRSEFAGWLERHFSLGAERFNDILLAVNEAIANAAEYAYVDASQPGTLDVTAEYDLDCGALAVVVTDRGRWRHQVPPPAGVQPQLRGRGIPLMQALADELDIDRTPGGTHVTLTWAGLTQGSPAT